MSFGRHPTTGETFAEKFPVAIYEPMPTVGAAEQQRRALAIEEAYAGSRWKPGAKRYLMFVLNPKSSPTSTAYCIGGFFDNPRDVMRAVFHFEFYPRDFRFFVVDPDVREEVEFIGTQMCDFWRYVFTETEETWWREPLLRHGLMERANLPPERIVSWVVSFDVPRQSVLDPKPGSADELLTLNGFMSGSKVVCVGMDDYRARHLWWNDREGTRHHKVGEVVRVFPQTVRMIVSHEQGDYMTLRPEKLRMATNEEIEFDRLQRVERAFRYAAQEQEEQ